MEESQREGGQFRRANIVYFLSRNGTVEQPHLFRVHHLHNNGVYLRDVKRWLRELRGNSMPDSFGWAYKRRYKSGYVWQDLKDEDLIPSFSDNEYVLKGSFIGDEIDKTVLKTARKDTLKVVRDKQMVSESTLEPEKLRDDNYKNIEHRMAVLKVNGTMKRRDDEQQKFRRSYSSRASHMFRNILTCGSSDVNESTLGPNGQAGGGCGPHRRSKSDIPGQQQQDQQGSDGDGSRKCPSSGKKRMGTTSFSPLGGPSCSLCGREFEPKKLHSHMQSCKALRGREKGKASSDSVQLRQEKCRKDDISGNSIAGYLT